MIDFLSDPVSWSVIIASVAIVLSQIPPICQLIKGRKVRISNWDHILLFQQMGCLNVVTFLDIRNCGGRPVEIGRIEFVLGGQSGSRDVLPARIYYSENTSGIHDQPRIEFPIVVIPLGVGERWCNQVRCYKVLSLDHRRDLDEIIKEVDGKRMEQYAANLRVNDSVVQKATKFFESQFTLIAGNYNLFIIVRSVTSKVLAIDGYRLTLDESDIQVLTSELGRYKEGIGLPSKNTPFGNVTTQQTGVPVPLVPMKYREAKRLYGMRIGE